MKIRVEKQVIDFIRLQPPERKRVLKLALRSLASEKGDIKPLEDPLTGYLRLRVGAYRLVFAYNRTAKTIDVILAEHRSIVYQLMEEALERELSSKRKKKR